MTQSNSPAPSKAEHYAALAHQALVNGQKSDPISHALVAVGHILSALAEIQQGSACRPQIAKAVQTELMPFADPIALALVGAVSPLEIVFEVQNAATCLLHAGEDDLFERRVVLENLLCRLTLARNGYQLRVSGNRLWQNYTSTSPLVGAAVAPLSPTVH